MALAAVATFTERRRGRPRHVKFTLADFRKLGAAGDERNLTLAELSDLSSVPKQKLLAIRPTHLDAFKPKGFNQFFVTYKEAHRFLRELRLI
jgi:hypothetical protein